MIPIILICGLGVLVYSNTFFSSFHFDDEIFIIHNPAIQNIHSIGSIWHFFHGRFLTFLSLAWNYHFNGFNVLGYHIFNLIIHLGVAVLVWWLVRLTLATPGMKGDKINSHANVIALLAGLIFAVHPVQTEAVTYIWQRAACMVTLFYLACLCLYVESRLTHSRICYRGALLMAVAAMFTKENSVTLPLMILVYEFTFLKTGKNLEWKKLTPFLLTILIVPMTFLFIKHQVFQKMHGDLKIPGGIITPMHYFVTQFRVMITYIRLVFIPVNQNFDYDYPIFNNIFESPVLASLLILIAIFYWSVRLFARYRLLSFGIFWFFLTLFIPESSFWPMGDMILEHRLYLPLVGYSIFLASGAYYLWGKSSVKIMMVILTLVIACYAFLTYQRNKVWKNELTLWDDAAQKSPHKARPYINRGFAHIEQGQFLQAIPDYTKAIEINPQDGNDYINRATTYYIIKEYSKAMCDLQKAQALGYAVDPALVNALKK